MNSRWIPEDLRRAVTDCTKQKYLQATRPEAFRRDRQLQIVSAIELSLINGETLFAFASATLQFDLEMPYSCTRCPHTVGCSELVKAIRMEWEIVVDCKMTDVFRVIYAVTLS
ncbi:hypothetical protein L596_023321 [Steinernema carpocapsae]|uniref:Uncharacterized protein n=1 Tax=Steinernema carpocapsae TaxID=34508 RepID=A0A4U5MDA3_STECR|nr:hypothetical protein L596_023321 [Steinernema carpocapsae]